MTDVQLARTLMDAGLSSGEAARVIADARATISPHETVALAVARVLLRDADAHTTVAADLDAAARRALQLDTTAEDAAAQAAQRLDHRQPGIEAHAAARRLNELRGIR